MKTLLLTGATGMVGGAVLRHFTAAGWRVIAAVPQGEIDLVGEGMAVPFDLADEEIGAELTAALKEADMVIHSAAVLPAHIDEHDTVQRNYLLAANVLGTVRLVNLAVAQRVSYFIQIGTTHDSEAGLPENYYKLSKWLTEQVAQCTLRICAPYGPGYRSRAVIPTMIERALAGQDIELWGDGSREQTFTYVDDIARACELALAAGAAGVFTIAGPRAVTMRVLAETVLGAIPGTGSRIVFTGRTDPNQGVRRRISFAEAQRAFGYRPDVDLPAGIRKIAAGE